MFPTIMVGNPINPLMPALLVGLSIPLLLDKVPPNPWYGFRVPSTLANANLWYKVNRYTARWLLSSGILTATGAVILYFAPGLTVDRYAWLCLAVFLGLSSPES
jgi:hypothetical protein